MLHHCGAACDAKEKLPDGTVRCAVSGRVFSRGSFFESAPHVSLPDAGTVRKRRPVEPRAPDARRTLTDEQHDAVTTALRAVLSLERLRGWCRTKKSPWTAEQHVAAYQHEIERLWRDFGSHSSLKPHTHTIGVLMCAETSSKAMPFGLDDEIIKHIMLPASLFDGTVLRPKDAINGLNGVIDALSDSEQRVRDHVQVLKEMFEGEETSASATSHEGALRPRPGYAPTLPPAKRACREMSRPPRVMS